MAICPKCGQTYPKVGVACTNAICTPEGIHSIHEDEMEKAQSDPKIGQLSADKYVITGRISKGGMGAVYRAVQLPVEREVAFKVLRTEMEDSDQGRDRFIQEAKAISRLTHPNIIVLHDFGFEKSGHPYMVMEYAPGDCLTEWIEKDDLTIDRIMSVTQQLLSALEEAHDQGIVHRDLKPDNIIIVSKSSQQDYVKLLDFGIARIINESSTRGLTREGEVFGTPHYMAPEQAQGAKNIGPSADIYAVGIIVFEMICGYAPFDADSPLAVLLKHLNEPLPEIIPREGVHATEDLLQFVRQMCEKDAANRFEDATQTLAALNHILLNVNSSGRYASMTGAYLGVSQDPFKSGETPTPSMESKPKVNQQLVAPLDMPDEDDFAVPPSNNNKAIIIAVLLLFIIGGGAAFAILGNQDKKDIKDNTNNQKMLVKNDPTTKTNDKVEIKTDSKTDDKTEVKTDDKTDNKAVADNKENTKDGSEDTETKTDGTTDEKTDTKTDNKEVVDNKNPDAKNGSTSDNKGSKKTTRKTKRNGSKKTPKEKDDKTTKTTKADDKTTDKANKTDKPVEKKKGPAKFMDVEPEKKIKPKKFDTGMTLPP